MNLHPVMVLRCSKLLWKALLLVSSSGFNNMVLWKLFILIAVTCLSWINVLWFLWQALFTMSSSNLIDMLFSIDKLLWPYHVLIAMTSYGKDILCFHWFVDCCDILSLQLHPQIALMRFDYKLFWQYHSDWWQWQALINFCALTYVTTFHGNDILWNHWLALITVTSSYGNTILTDGNVMLFLECMWAHCYGKLSFQWHPLITFKGSYHCNELLMAMCFWLIQMRHARVIFVFWLLCQPLKTITLIALKGSWLLWKIHCNDLLFVGFLLNW